MRLRAGDGAAVQVDLTFTARTAAHGLRRGTMKRGSEIIWDQCHMIQSGNYSGTYTHNGVTRTVDNWWGQRDHSWGIRDHARCPLWMWLAIQLPDGMLGVWHWEYANGARVYTDGCFAPADGSEPIPVVDFRHELHWTDENGKRADYGKDGARTVGLAGHVEFALEGGRRNRHRCGGHAVRAVRGARRGAAPDVGAHGRRRSGTAIYEVTGAHHHRYFPIARGGEPAAGLRAEDFETMAMVETVTGPVEAGRSA